MIFANWENFQQDDYQASFYDPKSPPRWGCGRETAPRKSELAGKMLSTSLVLLQEMSILNRTAYQQKVRWLQSRKGKRRAGQVFPSEKRTRKSFWRSAVPLAPQISLPCSACLLCNLCVYWMTTDFVKQACRRNRGYILLSYCCHFYSSL